MKAHLVRIQVVFDEAADPQEVVDAITEAINHRCMDISLLPDGPGVRSIRVMHNVPEVRDGVLKFWVSA